ncbi:MAG: TerB family tellurite resistance protein [Xanthomonadales bacterium]|nr:Co-chaperone protein DjlA [Xanthomonadales bacterium]MCC6594198.1 TerB family tellurite resistance protein [Xanthomonadales bacterium]
MSLPISRALGKLVGGGLGLAVAGPYGAAAGLLLGHALDAGWLRWRPQEGLRVADPRLPRIEFLFLWLGHLAKADGRVSEGEVAAAEQLMQRLKLDAGARQAAIRAFQRGRQQALDVADEVAAFRRRASPTPDELADMLRAFADFARRDGPMAPAERGLVERLGAGLGFGRERVAELIAARAAGMTAPALEDCYRALGLTPGASDDELTRAWRRLLAQNHPDKLQGQGADAAALRAAEARTRELRSAYERIVAARARRSA